MKLLKRLDHLKTVLWLDLANYPLARRLVGIVILASLGFTLITTAVQVLLDYRNEVNLLNARLEQTRVVDLPSLTNSVWHFDRATIETQLQGMLNLQDIRFVELQVSGDQTYSVGKKVPAEDTVSQKMALEYTQNGVIYALGHLLVVADIRSLQQRVIDRLGGVLFLAAVQIFLLAGFILFVIERLITRPLNAVVRHTETLDMDHLEEPLVLQRRWLAAPGDELELVALKLNEMRMRLKDDIAEREKVEAALRLSERNYREIFNATTDAILVQDFETSQILQVNQSMLRAFGYQNETEVLGRPVSELSSNKPPYTQLEADQYIRKAVEEGPQMFEWLARKKSGEKFWTEVSLRISAIGGEYRALAVVRDITERKLAEEMLLAQNEELIAQRQAMEEAEAETRQLNAELEERVNERTLELAASNQELEAFNYSVAHDLRAPLRHIGGYMQALQESMGPGITDESQRYLSIISQSARHMSRLIDDLLTFSRMGHQSMRKECVDTVGLAHEVIREMEPEISGRQVAWKIDGLPLVTGDRSMLKVVMVNLIANALKFSATRAPAEIEVGCLPESETEDILFVRDNGVGFDMQYADKLFGVFQRLHSLEDFEGTGIGLANVRRVISRHGGRTWAEGAVERGATFYFSLPRESGIKE
jgi:PAS domain S-box-containing protein